MANLKPLKKITTKHIFGGPAQVRAILGENPKNGDHAHLCRIAGVATGVRRGESTMGQYSELHGDFRAITSDGTVYSSSKAFLPDGAAHDMTVNAVEGSEGDVEFAFDFGITRDDSSVVGYVYDSTALLEVQESDRIGRLMSTAGMIEGPKPETPTANETGGSDQDESEQAATKKAGGKK